MNPATSDVLSVLPLLAVLIPFVGAAFALQLRQASGPRRAVALGTLCAATVLVSWALVPGVLAGTTYEIEILHIMPEIWIYLRADAMGTLFGATASSLWFLALVYSGGYLADGRRLGRYYGFLMLCLGLTLGVAYAGNLFTLLVFYELFSIMTYPLIVQEETPAALAAGTKYIVYVLIGGTLVLLGVIFTYFLADNVIFSGQGSLTIDMGRTRLAAIFWCFLVGFGVKAALVPLHGWVPDAHPAAPAPFSALLSGVMVAAGAFGIGRVVFEVFGATLLAELGVMRWVAGLAGLTVVVGAILAINQDDLKRRLAYSTISQMGYVILAFSLLGAGAVTGGLIHITHHAFMKATLFFCAGLMIKQLGVRRVSDMAGMARRMPITTAAFSLAAVGMIGTPPLSGFVSKWVMGLGIVEVGHHAYLAVLLGGALLAAVYLMPIVYAAYFKERARSSAGPARTTDAEAPIAMLIPTILAAAATIVLGLAAALPGMPLSLARMAVAAFFR